MSLPGMTAEQAALMKLQYVPAVQYRALNVTEVTEADRQRQIENLRKTRRLNQLREEYRWLREYKVVLESPDGRKNASFRLEELFEMFTLTQDWRDAVL